MDEFDYVGDCCICEKPLADPKYGICYRCKQIFCWSKCGGWSDFVTEQICNDCIDEEIKEYG